tara:strand:+ start:1502 stop:1693 length:192 start_codon:yes stop_codon:yes gene_type:complete
MTKKFWRSKGVWIGICTILIGTVEIVRQLVESGDFSVLALLTAFAGVVKVVERFVSTGDSISL